MFITVLIRELVNIDVDFVFSHILTGFDDHYFERKWDFTRLVLP